MTSPRRLTAVAGTSKKDKYDYRCRVAVQAVLEGMQEVRVQAVTGWQVRATDRSPSGSGASSSIQRREPSTASRMPGDKQRTSVTRRSE
jgi:hypothetical protein